jgi:hypothetical protein
MLYLPEGAYWTLVFTLLIGTPVLSLFGSIGVALTVGLGSRGLILAVIVLPLTMPVLIIGAKAVTDVMFGLPVGSHFALLGAILALALGVAPYVGAEEVADAVTWTSRVLPSLTDTTGSGGMLDVDALVRGIQRPVCRPDELPQVAFSDVLRSSVHAPGISCLVVNDIVFGQTDGTYEPSEPVTRAQLSSLLARVLDDAGVAPTTAPPDFEDVDLTSVHASAISLLSSVEVVFGDTDGRFRPDEPVTRGQMASLLVRTYEQLTETSGVPSRPWFVDTVSSVHRTNIDVGRDLGILRGVGGDDYAPTTVTRRDQIASFVARTLDALARESA